MPGTIGYSVTPSADVTLSAGGTEQARLIRTPGGDYVATTGDTGTLFHIYVAAGGSGADSTLNFGLYTGASTDPSLDPLVFSDSIVITAAMKSSPGWYTKVVSWALVNGLTYRVAYAGVAAGTLAIGADGGGSAAVNGGINTLPNPFGVGSFGSSTIPGMYVTVSGATTNYTMPAAQGSYAVNGQTVSFITGHGISAAQGSYSVIGSNAQIDIIVTAAQGSYAVNGQAVTFGIGAGLSADMGLYTVSGKSVILKYSGAVQSDGVSGLGVSGPPWGPSGPPY